jgi:hypothetical protein
MPVDGESLAAVDETGDDFCDHRVHSGAMPELDHAPYLI